MTPLVAPLELAVWTLFSVWTSLVNEALNIAAAAAGGAAQAMTPTPSEDLRVLGLTTRPLDRRALRRARNQAIFACHPDRGGDPAQAARVNLAYERLAATLP